RLHDVKDGWRTWLSSSDPRPRGTGTAATLVPMTGREDTTGVDDANGLSPRQKPQAIVHPFAIVRQWSCGSPAELRTHAVNPLNDPRAHAARDGRALRGVDLRPPPPAAARSAPAIAR